MSELSTLEFGAIGDKAGAFQYAETRQRTFDDLLTGWCRFASPSRRPRLTATATQRSPGLEPSCPLRCDGSSTPASDERPMSLTSAAAPSPRNEFGRLLRHRRDRRGLSQLDLSVQSGVSQRHISFIESGRSTPGRPTVLSLARELDVPLRE